MTLRFWLALIDLVAWSGFSGSRLWLWLIGKAAAADYARWGSDRDTYHGDNDDPPF